jgi:hypothetical protein
MKRSLSVFVVLLVGLVLVGIFGSSAAAPPPAPPRTSLPTWTLPFSLVTATPAALDTAPVLPLDNATFTGTPAQPEPTDQPVTAAPPSPTVVPPTPVVPPQLVVPALKIDQSIVPVAIVGNIWDLADLGEQIGRLTTTGEHPGDSLAMTLVGHVTVVTEGALSIVKFFESLLATWFASPA